MFKIFLSILAALVFLAGPLGLEPSFAANAKIVWKATGLDKPVSDPVVASNGLIYFPSGKQLSVLDGNGKKISDLKLPNGTKKISLVFGSNGSVFMAGLDTLQEIKSNGGSGWSIRITDGKNKPKSTPLLSFGPGSLLYMPLPTALYTIDTNGRYKWKMAWETQESRYPIIDTKREIFASAVSDDYLYVIYGIKKSGFTLAAVSLEGECVWRYGLGDIKGAGLTTDPEGNLYVTTSPTKVEKAQKGRLYLFESGGDGSPAWTYTTPHNDLTVPAFSDDGRVYFCAAQILFAVDAADGEEIWHQNLYNENTRPVINQADGKIYMGTSDKRLLTVDPEGRLVSDITLEGNVTVQPLAVVAGEVYVATDKGVLYKIADTSTGGD